MSIEKQWESMHKQEDLVLSATINQQVLREATSKDPLTILKKNILGNTAWAIIIGIGYLIVIVKFPYWPIIICIGITFIFTCIGIVTNIMLYKTINRRNNANSLLEEMERHYFTITAWVKSQEKAMLFVYPVAAAGGFMLGMSISSGQPIEEIMQKTVSIVSMVVLTAVFVPTGYFIAKYLNKKAFGRYCDQLKENIDALKEER